MKREIPKPEAGCPEVDANEFRIEIDSNGPYLIYGKPPLHCYVIANDKRGNSWDYDIGKINYISTDDDVTALCRCGNSKGAPYCDGSHVQALKDGLWDSELTATMRPPLDFAQTINGPELFLTDTESLCAYARFCDAKGRTWNQVEGSDDPEVKALAIRTSMACPAGRLKAWDKHTGEPYEPVYKPQLGLIEDPTIRVSGPIFVMGGIPILKDNGEAYQPRNRVTLCRCGESRNKPYCDGTHAPAHYHDNIPLNR